MRVFPHRVIKQNTILLGQNSKISYTQTLTAMTSLRIKSALLFSLMLSAAALSYAAHAAPAAAPAASAEPASGTMVMTARETPEAACARGEGCKNQAEQYKPKGERQIRIEKWGGRGAR